VNRELGLTTYRDVRKPSRLRGGGFFIRPGGGRKSEPADRPACPARRAPALPRVAKGRLRGRAPGRSSGDRARCAAPRPGVALAQQRLGTELPAVEREERGVAVARLQRPENALDPLFPARL